MKAKSMSAVAPKAEQASAVAAAAVGVCCPDGHSMEGPFVRDDGWACDGRKHQLGCLKGCTGFRQTNGWQRFQCAQCDFDLCELCAERAKKRQDAEVDSDDEGTVPGNATLDALSKQLDTLKTKLRAERAQWRASDKRIDELYRKVYDQGKQIGNTTTTLEPFDAAWSKPMIHYKLPESIYTAWIVFPLSGPWSQEDMGPKVAACIFCLPLFNCMLGKENIQCTVTLMLALQ